MKNWIRLSARLGACAACCRIGVAGEPAVPAAAGVIRAEALRPNRSPEGRPLPLLAHWHRMTLPPAFQVEMIRQGHPVLPWIACDRRMNADQLVEQHGEALQYEKLGIACTPELYGGWTQYGLWTVTPRVARDTLWTSLGEFI